MSRSLSDLYKYASSGFRLRGKEWVDLLYENQEELILYVDSPGESWSYYLGCFNKRFYLYRHKMLRPRSLDEINLDISEISSDISFCEVDTYYVDETPFGFYLSRNGKFY